MAPFDQLNELSATRVAAALAWTLFHSLWQGMLFAIIAALILSFTKRTNPAFRYNVLCGLLLLLVCTSMLTFLYQYHIEPIGNGFFRIPLKLSAESNISDHSSAATSLGRVLKNVLTKVAGLITNYAFVITALWAVLSSFKAVRFVFGLKYASYIQTHQSALLSGAWQYKLDSLRSKLQVGKSVRLMESARLSIPVVYGFIKPVIFVPLGLLSQLPPHQIEAILLHELAHIRRNDYLVNLLQQIVEIIFFFNLALLWLSRRIREEREHCCDELAIAQTGDRKNYARALIGFKELALSGSITGALAFTGSSTSLLNRVSRVINVHNHTLNRIEKTALSGCGLALLFFLCFYRTPSQIVLPPVQQTGTRVSTDFPMSNTISAIGVDLLEDRLIDNTKGLKFELTNSFFVVNGVRQSDAVWQQLYSKFLKPAAFPIKQELRNDPGFGIYYDAVRNINGIGTAPPAWNN